MLRFYAVRCLLLNPLLFTIPKTVPAPFSDPRIRFFQGVTQTDPHTIRLVTHRLPPLALDLCTGAASVSARRRSPVSAADPTARGVAAWPRRARQEKKDKIIIFSLHIVTGTGGLWQVSEAPKYFPKYFGSEKVNASPHLHPPPHEPPGAGAPTISW